MYMADDSTTSLSWVYFILLTCLSNYLGGELVVAVMSVKFEDAKVEEQEKMREEEEQKVAVRAAQRKIREFKRTQKRLAKASKKTILSKGKGMEGGKAVMDPTLAKAMEEDPLGSSTFAMVGDLETAQVMQLAAVIKSQNRQKAYEKEQAKKVGSSLNVRGSTTHPFGMGGAEGSTGGSGGKRKANDTFFSTSMSTTPKTAAATRLRSNFVPSRRSSIQAAPVGEGGGGVMSKNSRGEEGGGGGMERMDTGRLGSLRERSATSSHLTSATTTTTGAWDSAGSSTTVMGRLNTTFNVAASRWSMHSELDVPFPTAPSVSTPASSAWYQVRLVCHRLIFSPASFWLFSFLTVLNCALLACDHWGISSESSQVLTDFNVAFFVCFALELILRLIAIEWSYFSHGYFILDLVIVILALLDSIFSGSLPVLSALKAFRVFRMFTVFRHWRSMQRIMKQAHSSLEDLFYFSLVLFLFVFIFAQMGVQLAKGREVFPQPEGAARDNWDSIGWAMIVVFQVSTPENWNQVLYDMVQGVGWGGGFFVIMTLLVGHYVIESLFVVVMFSHFGTDDASDARADDDDSPSQAVAPIDNVQAMLARAGVASNVGASGMSEEASSLQPEPQTMTKGGGGPELNRLLSFGGEGGSPILSRPATFFSRPMTAGTPKRPGTAGGGLEESGRTEGWMEVEEKAQQPMPGKGSIILTLDALGLNAGHRPSSSLLPDTSQAQPLPPPVEEGKEEAEERGQRLMSSLVSSDSPRLIDTPVQPHRPAYLPPLQTASSPPSASPTLPPRSPLIPSALTDPTGFLPNNSPIHITGTGFLGRLARNIERSKVKRAERERREEVEKLRSQRGSRSVTRRTSADTSKVGGGSEGREGAGEGSTARGSVSGGARGEERGGGLISRPSTARRRGEELERLEREFNAEHSERRDGEGAEGEGEERQRLRVQFELQRSREGSDEMMEGSGEAKEVTEVEAFTMLPRKDSAPPPPPDDSKEGAACSPSPVLPPHVLPPLAVIPPLPPPSPTSAVVRPAVQPPTPSPRRQLNLVTPPARPQSPISPLPALLSPSPASLPPLIPRPLIPSPTSPPISPPPRLSLEQPTYDAHVSFVRRRFVIPHHYPPGLPWYRVEPPPPFTSPSLYLFSPTNRIRLCLSRAVHSDVWSVGVLVLILVSCVLLACDSPALDANSTEGVALYWLDLTTTVLYSLEMACRFIVFGVVVGEGACLRNGWNVMELLIVLVSIASTIVPSVSGLKALRALRPLRILSRLPGAKLVVSSLGKSMFNIANVLVVSFLLLFCLAIVAVELFKGKLQQCLRPPSGAPLPYNQDACEVHGGVWTNPIWLGNYDNVSAALLVLFELCTEENWPTIMYAAVDATDAGLAPVVNYNQWNGVYFVVAIVVGSLFIKTLFTATILDGYSLNYAEITGAGGGCTPLQRQWIDFYKLTIDIPPPLSKLRPATWWLCKLDLRVRRFFFDTAKSQAFEYFFLGVILVNVAALSMSFSSQPAWYANLLTVVNSICTWLFVSEILILWLGSGVRDYFRTRFNQFDLVIVMLTAYEFFYEQDLVSFHIGFNPSIFRVIRMIRIFKLFQKFPRLVQLGQTVWFSLPALYNVTLLMVLEYFIFSVLGMALFGKVKHGFYMDGHGNYEDFPSAMVTLFREMTGENWNGIMRDCMVQPPFCDPGADECGSPVLSPLFHVGFQVMSAMLVMDLIVAIILNQFENQLEKEKRMDSALLTEHDMRVFGEHWAHFSRGSWTMPVPKLPSFLRYLPPPLGFIKGSEQLYGLEMAHFLDELKIPCDNQNVHYLDVIHQLGYRVFLKKYPDVQRLEDEEEQSIADLLGDDEDNDDSSGASSTRTSTLVTLPYTTAGIRLANEDLSLIARQAQRQFPSLQAQMGWESLAGQVHRVVICQKMLRGVFDRKRLRAKLVKPLLMEMHEGDRGHAEAAAAQHARGHVFDFQVQPATAEAEPEPKEKPLVDTGVRAASAQPSARSPGQSLLGSPPLWSPGMMPPLSPSSATKKYSVVAELMAMKALSKRSTFNQSMSHLSTASTSTPPHHPRVTVESSRGGGVNGSAGGRSAGTSEGQTPTSSGHSLTLPLLMKAASLPLASTREVDREEEMGDRDSVDAGKGELMEQKEDQPDRPDG